MSETTIIAPQKGPQERFLACSADICIYGGAAGGGKTYGLLMDPLRYISNPKFRAVLFRHNYNQITSEGGLWDTSQGLYGGISGARPRSTPRHHWIFPSGATLSFAHIERDSDARKWQGSQIAMIGFDELTHFSQYQFFYMLTRNRSTSGVKPYIRATCNPDADSWVANFISWWIDQDSGYPIKERSGTFRYMTRSESGLIWGDSRDDLVKVGVSPEDIKSVTFIASTLQDNRILMEKDPSYLANLKALPTVERERLLMGNWKIKPSAGLLFKRTQIREMLESIPPDVISWVRGWDLAATAEDEGGNPAYTASVLIGKRRHGGYVVANVTNVRLSAGDVREHIKNTAAMDKARYGRVLQRLPQDPGQAGKDQAQSFMRLLAGYVVKIRTESGDKVTRAEPFAAQWQHGQVDLVLGEWTEAYLDQLESFPESKFKDMVDASSSAFGELELSTVTGAMPEAVPHDSYWL